jgi:hypothetical protein
MRTKWQVKSPLSFWLKGLASSNWQALYFLALGSDALGARPPDLIHSSMVANGLKFVVAL